MNETVEWVKAATSIGAFGLLFSIWMRLPMIMDKLMEARKADNDAHAAQLKTQADAHNAVMTFAESRDARKDDLIKTLVEKINENTGS